MTVIYVDSSEVDRELRRLGDGPDVQDILRFEAILQDTFWQTQVRTHIITASLVNSGRVNSVYRNEQWRAAITYGGESRGHVYDPVRYAGYERHKGGTHDYMEPVFDYDERYVRAVLDFLRGGET